MYFTQWKYSFLLDDYYAVLMCIKCRVLLFRLVEVELTYSISYVCTSITKINPNSEGAGAHGNMNYEISRLCFLYVSGKRCLSKRGPTYFNRMYSPETQVVTVFR